MLDEAELGPPSPLALYPENACEFIKKENEWKVEIENLTRLKSNLLKNVWLKSKLKMSTQLLHFWASNLSLALWPESNQKDSIIFLNVSGLQGTTVI